MSSELAAIRDRLIEAARNLGPDISDIDAGDPTRAEAELAAASKAFDEWVFRTVKFAIRKGRETGTTEAAQSSSWRLANAILKREAQRRW